eukprot:TRINITY_DN1329_c0_g1_i5.p1 TRINITY_DN1329_c0_g1~~TRINITY_DN1329_c0_g1_i5.p1  ORF type:complete len:1191 (+),score=394.25 TRINITY_DN1329_c0_g1_i5:17-3589(+)
MSNRNRGGGNYQPKNDNKNRPAGDKKWVAKPASKQDEAARKKEDEERKKKEEEEKLKAIEEEKKRKEEAERKKQEEEERKRQEEERKRLEEEQKLREEQEKRQKERQEIRKANLDAAAGKRPSESFFKALDSSIKKNSTFIKKLQTKLTEENKDALIKELKTLNMNRFIGEVIQSITQAPLKAADCDTAFKVISTFHQLYAEFSADIIPALVKTFHAEKENLVKARSLLRLLTELYIYGVYSDHTIILDIVKQTVENRDKMSHNLSLMVGFVRYGLELLGIQNKAENTVRPEPGQEETKREEAENIVPANVREMFTKLVDAYYTRACNYLLKEHQALRAKERENRETQQTKGELSKEVQEEYSKMRQAYDKVLANVMSLAELLQKNLPALPEEESTTRISEVSVTLATFAKPDDSYKDEPLWEDDDQRTFYEVYPDLKALVPGLLDDKPAEKEDEKEPEKEAAKPAEEKKEADKTAATAGSETKEEVAAQPVDKFTEWKSKWPASWSRETIDKAAVEFCAFNNKANRKKLVKAMYTVHRSKLDWLPYFGRLTATLNQYWKDVGPNLVSLLEDEFKALYQEKNQINIETKVKNIRFLSELVRFRICPVTTILQCLRMLLDDFVYHNIDLACNLLETCGRFLYLTPESHVRINNMLEILMRLRAAKNLDARQNNLVENAFFSVKPPERPIKQKQRPIMQDYIRKLIYEDLNKGSVKMVLKKLKKLSWAEDEEYILKKMYKIYKGKFSNIHLIASLVSSLSKHHPIFSIKFVDMLLEDIREGLEENDFNSHQRLVMNVKLLGELYNYRLVENQIIFDTLYTFIAFGHATEEEMNEIDPPDETFRIRLVCTLLETCGQYFSKGATKDKLDRFLVYFQRYALSKGDNVSQALWFTIDDRFDELRPRTQRFATIQEANDAIVAIEKTIASTLGQQYVPFDLVSSAPYKIKKNDESGVHPAGQEEEEEDDERKRDLEDEHGDPVEQEDDYADGLQFDEESEEEEEEEDDEEDLVDYNNGPADPKKVPEDDEFLRELDMMVSESREVRRLDTSSGIDRALPQLRKKAKNIEVQADSDHRVFQVLLKRGPKQQVAQLAIPADSKLARNQLQKDEEELEEQKEIKRLVLQYAQTAETEEESADKNKKKPRTVQITLGQTPYMEGKTTTTPQSPGQGQGSQRGGYNQVGRGRGGRGGYNRR